MVYVRIISDKTVMLLLNHRTLERYIWGQCPLADLVYLEGVTLGTRASE